ncbi:MAG: hypothetical protein O3B65_05755, partial [Chloroflexi bacterium]|nr:hypothetical protein [Chloroflexota bacterium]
MKFRFNKLVITVLLGAVLAIVLAACGGEDPTPTPRATNTPVPPTATPLPGTTAVPATATPVPTPTPSFDVEAHFKGKTMRMLVGFGQGGGTDAQGRAFAKNWGKFIPGNPRIIVQNITPNITERNFVWHADPDGLTLGTEATSGIIDQLEVGADFDMREVSAIGATSGGDSFWATWDSLPYGCADTSIGGTDLIKIADSIPSAESFESTAFNTALAASAVGIPLQLIHVAGDTGSAGQKLMLQRGDVNSWSSSTVWGQLPRTNPGWVADGKLRPFLDMSVRGVRMKPNAEQVAAGATEFGCPHVSELSTSEELTNNFHRFADVRGAFAKNILGPPNMPPEILAALRAALDAAMANEEFVTNLERASSIPTIYTPGE